MSKAANRKDQKYHRSLFLFPFLRARTSRGRGTPLTARLSFALKALGKERDCSQSTIKFPDNARSVWLKQRPLSENKEQVNDIKLAFKILLRNFDKFDPN